MTRTREYERLAKATLLPLPVEVHSVSAVTTGRPQARSCPARKAWLLTRRETFTLVTVITIASARSVAEQSLPSLEAPTPFWAIMDPLHRQALASRGALP